MPSPTSSPLNCRCNSDQNFLPSPAQWPLDPTYFTPLILETPQTDVVVEEDNSAPGTTHLSLLLVEALSILFTPLFLYSRSIISILFLARLDALAFAGASLAIAFANITGYSILSSLALGMEPLCRQALGAKNLISLGHSLQRTILLLLFTCIPIGLLWLNIRPILLLCGLDDDVAIEAHSYILFSLPDLFAQSFLHHLRIYLRTQSITLPFTLSAALSLLLHIPINNLLVSLLGLGNKGVALAGAWSSINLVIFLIIYISLSGVYKKTWDGISMECLKGWKVLLDFAVPICASVCLEWWWYEIMILFCVPLLNPKATVASMVILILLPSSLCFGVGNKLGANHPDKARLVAIVGFALSFLLGFSALGFALAVGKSWATMFTGDAHILGLANMVLPIIGELSNGPQTTCCCVLRGTCETKHRS